MAIEGTAPLDAAEAMAAARAKTGLDDWGPDQSFRTGLAVLVDAVEAMAPGPALRRQAAARIDHILQTRLHLADDARRHPEIERQTIAAPLVVIGLPRTGTTITYDLLALDPRARTPREFEMFFPWPASDVATFATDPRIRTTQDIHDNHLAHAPQLAEIQRFDSTQPGECNHGMMFHFAGSNFPAEFGVPKFAQWIIDEIPDGLYRTHKRLLQQCQWQGPQGRWVIKSPHHLFDLEGLVGAYPDAGLIWTHRDPVATLSSLSSFIAGLQAAVGQGGDRKAVGRAVVDMWSTAMARATRIRRDNPAIDARIIDIAHRDVVHDPVGQVRRIYDRFGIAFRAEDAARIADFLARNPSASRLGKHRHQPEDFGIDRGEVHARLADYYDRFGPLLARP